MVVGIARFRGKARWVSFLRVLTTTTALTAVSLANGVAGQELPVTQLVQVGQHSFDIPPQPLADALALFGRQSGMQISADAGLIRGIPSPGVNGTMTAEQALPQLLAGTGINWHFAGDGTVMLSQAAGQPGAVTLNPITVEGRIPYESAFEQSDSYRAGHATVGSKTDSAIREVPSSVQVVTRQVLDDQRRQSVTDALAENVSGVTRDTTPSIFGDNLRIRGFVANGNYLRNGVPDTQIGRKTGGTLADVERIEVLKGPASVLYGLGSPGGTVNILTKQPLYEPLYEIGGTIGNYDLRRLDTDVSQPLTDDGRIAARINVAVEDSGSFADFEEQNQFSITPIIRFDARDATRLTLEANYSERRTSAVRSGLPAIGTVITGPNGQYIPQNRNLNEPTNSDSDSDTLRVGYRFETEFNETLTFRSQGDYARYRQTGRDYAMVAGGEAFGFGLQGDNRTYGRGLFEPRGGGDNSVDTADIFYTDNNLVAQFNTGDVSHKAVTGVSYSYEDALNGNFQISGPFFIDVYDPIYTAPTGAPIVEMSNTTITQQYGFYAQDQLGFFDDRLKLVLGGRYDIVRLDGTDELIILGTGDPTELTLRDRSFSGRGGIIYDLTKEVSVYSSYTQSYVPQARVDQNGDVIEPETGEQYEVGVKADWLGGRLSTTLALFDLTRDNVARTVGLNVSASGQQRSRGVEFDVSGELAAGWKVIGSYTYMDTEVLSDSDPAEQGLRIANTPDNKFTLATNYTIQSGYLRDLSFGGGVVFLDRRRVQNSNAPEVYLPSFWRFDLAAGYRLGLLDLRLNVLNVFDTRYFVAATDINEIYDGVPLTVLLTAKLRF